MSTCRADTAVSHARSPTDFSLNTVVYIKWGTRKPAPPNFFNFCFTFFVFWASEFIGETLLDYPWAWWSRPTSVSH